MEVLGYPSPLHPLLQVVIMLARWKSSLQEGSSLLQRADYAVVQAGDLQHQEDLLKLVIKGGLRFEPGGLVTGQEVARKLWRAVLSGLQVLNKGVTVRLLEAHPGLLWQELEQEVLDGLLAMDQEQKVVFHEELLSAVAASRALFTAAMAMFKSLLLATQFNPHLTLVFQQFFETVRARSRHLEQLLPLHLQHLGLLLVSWQELEQERDQLARSIADVVDLASLEERLLLLQFPSILPYLYT